MWMLPDSKLSTWTRSDALEAKNASLPSLVIWTPSGSSPVLNSVTNSPFS